MLILFYLLLSLTLGRYKQDQIFETKSVGVGDNATLTCSRQISELRSTLFWIRLVSGTIPEFFGGTYSFDYDGVNKTPRITTKQEPGTFILHINEAKLSDTGVYYCINVNGFEMTLLKGTFLRIEGTEPDITAIIQDIHSDPVLPGDSVTLQCSVFSDSENKTCPGGHSVFWFRARSDETPSLVYAEGNSSDGCERSPEAHSPQKCVYSFSKNVSSSDAGTYYCAVATCGEILFGNGTKLDIEALNMWDMQQTKTALILLCAALAISLIVIAVLIYSIKNKTCECCNNTFGLQTNSATAGCDQQSQQRHEDSLVYSAPTFSKKKTGRAERRNATAGDGETVYSDVRVKN
ncbi:signal-regulatory protein beta-2-like [Centropristis striata]|uniref:signal-regulatory protein beta-2-like n=1 Tax=Centropristis striata TaxID=184440 RepID=UPI0027DF11B0|nr:signal-regulatory protein beta-2-like [Centropristis striata]